MLALLVAVWGAARWRATRSAASEGDAAFEDEPADRILTLDLSHSASR